MWWLGHGRGAWLKKTSSLERYSLDKRLYGTLLTPTLALSPAGTLTNKAVNGIHWSPNGHNIVLSGLKALNGQLEFFNVDEFEILAAAEHFMATNVEWDPTGGVAGRSD